MEAEHPQNKFNIKHDAKTMSTKAAIDRMIECFFLEFFVDIFGVLWLHNLQKGLCDSSGGKSEFKALKSKLLAETL